MIIAVKDVEIDVSTEENDKVDWVNIIDSEKEDEVSEVIVAKENDVMVDSDKEKSAKDDAADAKMSRAVRRRWTR